MKSIKFRCGNCSKGIEAGSGLGGSRVICPHCRKMVDVPALPSRDDLPEPVNDDDVGRLYATVENAFAFVAIMGVIIAVGFGSVIMIGGGVVSGGIIIAAGIGCGFAAFCGILLIQIRRDIARIASRRND